MKIITFKNFKKAFTLAEVMIVLSVIGVLTAILLPVAFHSAPDENIMKFKKANNTLGIVIRELVNSDKYYANGDLGIKADGTLVDSATYFCETFADVVSVKSVNCATSSTGNYEGFIHVNSSGEMDNYNNRVTEKFDGDSNIARALDKMCLRANMQAEIITSDGISFFQNEPECHFGIKRVDEKFYKLAGLTDITSDVRLFNNAGSFSESRVFDMGYKVFCIDVDGVNKGEDPFGYGIRADGKIFPGARANEWINKSIQKTE